MAEFMAQAHEKRLQAMEAVKAEVQRGYEDQIADLQSKVRAPPIWRWRQLVYHTAYLCCCCCCKCTTNISTSPLRRWAVYARW